MHKIFYSWQSDLPNSANRGLIADCLTKVIKEISNNEELELEVCLDRDTQGTLGSPDIASTIFSKIQSAAVFVADVSFVDQANPPSRRTPNPNVMIELGYAAAYLEWDRVICVFNKAFGRVEDLPFDIRFRRILSYELPENEDKSLERKKLAGMLAQGITEILHAPHKKAAKEKSAFLTDLNDLLVDIIIFCEGIPERMVDPWLAIQRSQLKGIILDLRKLAISNVADNNAYGSELESLIEQIQSIVEFRLLSGSGTAFQLKLREVVESARKIKQSWIDIYPLGKDASRDLVEGINTRSRELQALSSRVEKFIKDELVK